MFSCGQNGENPNNSSDSNQTNELNLDDLKVREEILSKSIEGGSIRWEDGLGYAPGQQTPYTGWVGGRHPNGKVAGLWYAKDGVKGGLWVMWHDNGQKRQQLSYSNNQPVGLSVTWDRNGKELGRHSY